jgi:hypothetical protein
MKLIIVALAGLLVQPAALSGQQFDSSSSRTVAPGVTHRQVVINSGPWRVNILEINLRQPGLSIVGVRAGDRFTGRETVSSMARRFKGPGTAVAAINGDFFNIRATGESENNVVIEGRMLKGVGITDSPYDTFNTIHSQFAVDSSNKPLIERFAFRGTVSGSKRRTLPLDALNFWPDSNALVLYTPVFGTASPVDSAGRHPLTVSLRRIGEHGDTILFRVTGRPRDGAAISLSRRAVLAAGGRRRSDLRSIAQLGSVVRIVTRLRPEHRGLRTVMGGWPRLIIHGSSIADSVDAVEGTFPRFSAEQHPRTAVGFSRDSATLYLVAVDGRQESRAGMSLAELARLMLELGVYEGMNFDGGGSTTMVVNGKVVNSPSDKTGERAVGSALLVVTGK